MSVAVSTPAPGDGARRFRVNPGRIGLYAFLIFAALFFLIPLLIVFNTSLKPMEEIRTGGLFELPIDPSFAAWGEAWSSACTGRVCEGIGVGFWNSVKIMVPGVIFSILISAMNGYALAQWRFRGATLILTALMLGAFIPYQVILYPMVRILSTIGAYGTLPGIILTHIIFGLPVLTLIFRNFYAGMPQELIKAARIDGAGFFRIFFSIMLPMSTNILIVAVILQVTGIWNDYLLGLIFAGRENLPMTVQLTNIVGSVTGEHAFNVDMAATMLTALPPLIVYFLAGRYFVRGITAGAVKG